MSQKNHTFLLDVFAEVSKRDSLAHLVLLGDGELMDAMKEKASNLGIKDRVTFVGNVGNANEWYRGYYCYKNCGCINSDCGLFCKKSKKDAIIL